MKKSFILLLIICTCSSVYAFRQSDSLTKIRGLIIDNNKTPVSNATIALFTLADSSQKAVQISDDDGVFSMPVQAGNYFIKINFASFEEKLIAGITVIDKEIDLGTISLLPAAKVLKEVVVTSQQPQMKLELDKRVYTVGKDLANIGGTASDVLNNVPSVTVDVDGSVSLRGSQNVRILIDGKPSALTSTADALRQLPGNIIESIEVITNPSSRYEAAGEAGIINIILKKNTTVGLNGTFTVNAGYPAAYGGSFNINYRKNKLNLFSTYGIDYRSTPGQGNSYQVFRNADTSFAYEQKRSITRSGLSHNLIVGMDYFPNLKNTITASFLYNPSDGINESVIEYFDYDEAGNLKQVVTRNEKEDENDKDMEASLSYRKKFAEKDHQLTVDFKYIWGDEIELTDYQQGKFNASEIIYQRAVNLANEHTWFFQSDYVHPFADKGKFETGVRTSTRNIQNDYLLEQNNGEDWIVLPAFNNNMLYTEKIHAAYVMGSRKANKWTFQGGLRLEYSDITTELTKTAERNNRNYLNLFPSANISYAWNDKNTLQLSYSYRINRPQYRDLLPYSDFSDLRSFFKGNPNLNPEFTHSWEAGHLLNWEKGTLLSNIYYRHRKDVIQRFTEVDSAGIAYIFPINLSTQDTYGAEFNLLLNITNWWRFNSTINLFRVITNGTYNGEDLYSDAYTATSRTSSKFTVFKKWEVQTTFNYRAPRVTPQGKDLSMYFLDLGIAGDILKGKATVTFNVRDLLNSRKRRTVVDQEDYYSKNEFQWRSRQFMLTLSYRLNRLKEKQPEKTNTGEDSDGDM